MQNRSEEKFAEIRKKVKTSGEAEKKSWVTRRNERQKERPAKEDLTYLSRDIRLFRAPHNQRSSVSQSTCEKLLPPTISSRIQRRYSYSQGYNIHDITYTHIRMRSKVLWRICEAYSLEKCPRRQRCRVKPVWLLPAAESEKKMRRKKRKA